MKFLDILTISFKNLFRQKLRTALTIFSIVIGATLISVVYAVIPGFEKFFDMQFNSLSSPKLIEIYAAEERPGVQMFGSIGQGPEEYEEGESNGSGAFEFGSFKDSDIEKIESIEGVKKVHESPMPTVEYIQLAEGDKRLKVSYAFYYPTFLLENMDLVSGEKLKEGEVGKILVANEFVESFGYENPDDLIGKKVILNVQKTTLTEQTSDISASEVEEDEKNFEFEIVGISEKSLLSSIVFIPLEDALEMTKFSRNTEDVLTDEDDSRYFAWVELEDETQADEVNQKIKDLGFSGMTYEDSKTILNDMFGIVTVILSSFGVIAMAVSSLGILNTLIMAVYERTREIGVMKAIGATKSNIAVLFTLEASFIGFFGGLIGLVTGYLISELLNYLGHKTILASFESLDLSNVSPLLFLGLGISVIVATIAGIYPAIRAARLDPVDALKYE